MNLRFSVFTPLFLLLLALSQRGLAISIGVVLSDNNSRDRYIEVITDLRNANFTDIQAEVRWIEVDTKPYSIPRSLVDAWATGDLDLIINLVDTCAIQLELAAAWNLSMFTSGCTEHSDKLYTNPLYLTHIRLDPTWRTMAASVHSLLLDINPTSEVVSLQSSSLESDILARELLSRQVIGRICRQCIPSSGNQVLMIFGNSSDIVNGLKMVYNVNWRTIVLVTNQSLTQLQAADLLANLTGSSADVYLLQPTHNASYSQVEYFRQAYTIYMKFLEHEMPSRVPHLPLRLAQHLLSDLQSSCFNAGLGDQITCFDEKVWSLGNYTAWSYRSTDKVNNFYSFSTFIYTDSTWRAQMVSCNSSQPLYISLKENERRYSDEVDETTMTALYAVIAVLLAIIFACIAVFIWWAYRKCRINTQYNRGKPTWQISNKDVRLFEYDEDQQISGETGSLYSQALPNFVTDSDKLDADKETCTDFGYFKDQPVGLKKVVIKDFQFNKHQEKELEIMVGTHHENIAAFYGACIKPSYIMLVTQYCLKGSLEEIFLFEPVHMDETFISSIVMDIVRGMKYIHKTSLIGIHGNLKSSNCLVTGRWVVKLSGFGLTDVRTKYRKDRDYLWCAPEIIKKAQLSSQKADIYSFGIILYEVIGKQGPFGKGYTYSEEQLDELVARICDYGYHPETSWLCCEDYLKNIMSMCWQPSPKLRPDFQHLNQQLKPFHAIMNGRSIVDNMLVMMERYQMRLEDLVEEKTAQLQQEKRKTENLLHRMLPPQVANQLISGKKVHPENYSCITVLISDICGFTSLASTATPIQVIQLLNDLYTLFDSITKNYDVYKVETVGDAYLCVSGLPRPNGDRHAVEICLMALEFIQSLKTFKVRHGTSAKDQIQMRIGVHSGQCVAGVVGVSMPRYTLFGDTINVASRLESTGEPMKIQISQQTKHLLDKRENQFTCEKRGIVDIKGKGEMPTWWLVNADMPIPLHREQSRQLSIVDSLQLPSGKEKSLSTVSDLDVLSIPEHSRSRSNSIKSQNSSSKSAQVFQRAGSFRHKIKSDSLSSSQISESNIAKLGLGAVPSFPPINHDSASCRLLASPKGPNLGTNIVIQVDEPC